MQAMLLRLFFLGSVPMSDIWTLWHDTYSVSDPFTEMGTFWPTKIPHISWIYHANQKKEEKSKSKKQVEKIPNMQNSLQNFVWSELDSYFLLRYLLTKLVYWCIMSCPHPRVPHIGQCPRVPVLWFFESDTWIHIVSDTLYLRVT